MQIDLHADTPMIIAWTGYDFLQRHRAWVPRGAWASHVDLPRMEEADLDAQVFGLVALPVIADPIDVIHGLIDRVEAAEFRSEGKLAIVRSVSELRAARERGARGAFLSMEGVHPLRGQIERLDRLIDRGVVSFGLAHFHANEACSPSMGLGMRSDAGLTPFGREVVERIAERGALLDLTHISRAGFFEAIDLCRGHLFVSHTGVRGARDHWRNLDDEQIRAVADRGGVLGVIFSRGFLGGDDLGAVIRHVRHIIKVAGEAVPALGSDFDGAITPVRGLRDIAGLPALRQALLDDGLAARVVDGVMGDNAIALFERALG